MCIPSGGGGGNNGALQMLALANTQNQLSAAQQAQSEAAASVASANLDTNSSVNASENQMRVAARSSGFLQSLVGGPGGGGVGAKMLFGQ